MSTRIERLTESLQALAPAHLNIKDDSARHAGHAAMNGVEGEETHLVIEITSAQFAGKSRIECHRMVQKICSPEMDSGLHALQIKAIAA
ncbi:MAG: BolA family transcriptional regulator [Rickettsiales bacterium]|nr:BolA family transcriptional regulator [Rickettsiales bacterium]